jgi:threonine synthase
MIRYNSTNNSSPAISFGEALLKGLAPDKGLYMPLDIPAVTDKELESFRAMSYHQIAASVLWKFLEGDIDKDQLINFCREAYSFDIPVENVSGNIHLLRLDRGPTASFKDFAARIMARLFNYFLGKEGGEITILTATSGDTGSAIASAFSGMDRIKLVVLYPRGEVSELQRRQMTTIGGNVEVLAVDGKFDDCQALVKKAFSDRGLSDLKLSSANSINIGRLLPQTVYYFYAWSRLAEPGEKVIFSVPSGNFGNLTGGLFAARMGVPVEKFIVSVNENDEFPLFLKTGLYQKIEPSRNCISSAMNVGHPSNLARMIDLYGGSMDERGRLLKSPDIDMLRKDMASFSISDKLTKETVADAYKRHRSLIEPHGAVAWAGYNEYISNCEPASGFPAVILETAHPAKFPDSVHGSTGVMPPLPSSLERVLKKKERYTEMPADYNAFKSYLRKGNV